MALPARALLAAIAFATLGSLASCGGDGTPTDAGAAATPRQPAADAAAPDPVAEPGVPGIDGTSVPERFQGRYAADTQACTAPGHESRLEIGADYIRFHEGGGTIRSASAEGNMLTLVAELTAEGDTREAAYQFGLSLDGRGLHDLANGLARRRCD